MGDDRAGLAGAERALALALEPTRERAFRAAVCAHHAAGDRDAALRAYERCRRALANELGVVPTADGVELHLAILRDEAAIDRARILIDDARKARSGSPTRSSARDRST